MVSVDDLILYLNGLIEVEMIQNVHIMYFGFEFYFWILVDASKNIVNNFKIHWFNSNKHNYNKYLYSNF
jgi:hypothetical protein